MPGRGAELAMIIRARDDGVSAVFGGARKSVETFAIDIGRVVEQLRARGEAVSPESVSRELCPFAVQT